MSFFGNLFKPDLGKLHAKGDVLAIMDIASDEKADVKSRQDAIRLLNRYENKEIIDVLLSILKNQNNELRFTAADTLRYKAIKADPDPRAKQGLFDVLLKDPSYGIRQQASSAFDSMLREDITNSDAIRGLTILLNDPEGDIRKGAAYALLRLKGTQMDKIFEDKGLENRIRSVLTPTGYNFAELASDPNLSCSVCGKRPLLKKGDVIKYNSQELMDKTVFERAGKCTKCGKIVCTGCVKHLDKRLPDGYNGCPFCISRMEIL
jgi:HEAT repeat protein